METDLRPLRSVFTSLPVDQEVIGGSGVRFSVVKIILEYVLPGCFYVSLSMFYLVLSSENIPYSVDHRPGEVPQLVHVPICGP